MASAAVALRAPVGSWESQPGSIHSESSNTMQPHAERNLTQKGTLPEPGPPLLKQREGLHLRRVSRRGEFHAAASFTPGFDEVPTRRRERARRVSSVGQIAGGGQNEACGMRWLHDTNDIWEVFRSRTTRNLLSCNWLPSPYKERAGA